MKKSTLLILTILATLATSAQSATIYLCKNQKDSFWSQEECSKKNATLENSANVPTGLPFALQISMANQMLKRPDELSQTPYKQVNQVQKNKLEVKNGYCEAIQKQITILEQDIKIATASQTQDSNTLQKIQYLKDEFDKNCK